jgi:hypothetical protein
MDQHDSRFAMKIPYQERFSHLLGLISNERFLKMQGLGNEVPFFIYPFPAQEALEIEQMRRQLKNQLESRGVQIVDINLYDLAIELLQARGVWERILEMESRTEKTKLKELLQGVLDSEAHLIPAIAEKIEQQSDYDVLFISGVGEVFPYIRSHNVLNNLQSTAKQRPTVLFFPGEYTHSLEDGASLDLFGRLHDDKYYRAFNLFDFKV